MTYQEAYRKTCEILRDAGITDAVTDAWILFEHVTGMSRTLFYADGGRSLSEDKAEALLALTHRRTMHIPVQHLTGEQEFMGIPFLVAPSVLIPRQDTEVLVEEAEKVLRPGMRILDMCTGSGCIGVSLAVRNPGLAVTAADISEEALKIAIRNAEDQKVETEFVHSDMFTNIEGTYDMIISNPPYIPTEEITKLAEEVKLHDPFGALDGKADGLHFYRILAKESPVYLNPGGSLYLEIGYDQSEAVEGLLAANGFTQIRTQKDLAGLDRVVSGVYNRQ